MGKQYLDEIYSAQLILNGIKSNQDVKNCKSCIHLDSLECHDCLINKEVLNEVKNLYPREYDVSIDSSINSTNDGSTLKNCDTTNFATMYLLILFITIIVLFIIYKYCYR